MNRAQAAAEKDRLGIKVSLWMQLGVDQRKRNRSARMPVSTVVMNRCPKIEHGRFSGEIGWMGVNLQGDRQPQAPAVWPRRRGIKHG